MAKILILGSDGMLGSEILRVLDEGSLGASFDIIPTTRLKNQPRLVEFDYQPGSLTRLFSELEISSSDYVVNCVGWIPQRSRKMSPVEVQAGIIANCELPAELSILVGGNNAKVITIGTDCVFSGHHSEPSTESTPLSPVDFYGFTKAIHESTSKDQMVLRTSIIGASPRTGAGLFEWFKAQPKGAVIRAYSNHFWNGTSTNHFAKIVRGVIRNNEFLPGVQHLVPRDYVAKAQLLEMFKVKLGRGDLSLIPTAEGPNVNRLLSTDNPARNEQLWSLGGFDSPSSIEEAVDSI